MADRTLADAIKKYLLLYWLPSDAVAEALPVILGAYITVLSLLRNLAVNDSQDDLNNATLFEQPGFAEQYQYFSIDSRRARSARDWKHCTFALTVRTL